MTSDVLHLAKGTPSRDSQHLPNAHHILGSNGALNMLYLVASFPHHSEADASIIIPFHNWEDWGAERLHHTSSVISSEPSIWLFCRHCLWHNPHFHLGFWRNSLNSLQRLHVSWRGLDGEENGTASVPPWAPLLCLPSDVFCAGGKSWFSTCLWGWVMLERTRCDRLSQDLRNYLCVSSWESNIAQ